ncbi:MAG TPA: ferritin-like domain-containing protein [Acetobacteraceae bacterium]|nr:ferritin-like domain-containing protein [Acetobacteraceae bacterium]
MSPDSAILQAADYSARHWLSLEQGPLRPGTEEHKRAVAAMFQATFNPYKPSVIEWPKLDAAAHARLLSLPIWDIAVQTEGKAGLRMKSYAAQLADQDMRAAIELNAWEEGRHKEVLSHLVAAYGIAMAPEPEYLVPRDAEWAYLVTGFSECIDSFFAFGLFELARRSGFFPPELVETFEPVMQEECRHILLFANWLAWHRRTIRWWQRPWFELRVAAAWAFLAWERLRLAKGLGGSSDAGAPDNNFTISGAQAVGDGGVNTAELMDLCLAENDRRFAGYDARLARPTTVPWLVRLARRLMRRSKRADRADTRAGSNRNAPRE